MERERKGISPREMADRLHWMPSYITVIEENRFEVLRGPAFVRGYLRAYAKMLGMPEQPLIAGYDAMLPTHASKPPSVEPSAPLISPQRRAYSNVLAGLASAVLLIAGFWWWQSDAESVPDPQPAARSQPIAAVTAPQDIESDEVLAEEEFTLPAATETETPALTLADEPPLVAEAVAGEPVADAPDTADLDVVDPLVVQSAAPATGIASTEGILQFSFSGDCWLEVRNGNNELIYADLRRDGDSLGLDGLPPFTILLGDSRFVTLRYRDEPYTIVTRPGRLIARFTVAAP